MSAAIDVSDLAKDSESSKYESDVLAILSKAVKSPSPAETQAETTASEIDALYPADVKEAEDFLWTFWTLFVNVVKKIPADDARQQLLTDIIAQLKLKRNDQVTMWDQEVRVWTELPMLGPVMRDAWNLSPDFDGSETDATTVQEWISLNSFAARLYGTGTQDWVNFAIWELRSGLEEPPEDRPNARDTRIATAHEWIVHAGKELFRKSQEVAKLDTMEKTALKPGTLFKSDKPGLSTERWIFWRERIGALGATAGSGAAKEQAQKALQAMNDVDG